MNGLSEIKLDRTSPLPLFYQLAEGLRGVIESAPETDFKLPSERKISEMLHIDRSTVNKAFARLQESGLIIRKTPRTWQLSPRNNERQITSPACIGVIMPDAMANIDDRSSMLIMNYMQGILDGATEHQVALYFVNLPDTSNQAAKNTDFIHEISSRVIGVIHLGDRLLNLDPPLHKLMLCKNLPQVIVAAETEYPNVLQILSDDRNGAEKLAKALVDLNLTDIGIIQPWQDFDPSHLAPYFLYASFRRPVIFRETFLDHNLNCDDKFHLHNCSSYQQVLTALREKQQQNLLPQCYWCHNDNITQWLLQACDELNIRIPEDLSVVSFLGTQELDSRLLATVRQPFYGIGKQAVAEVINIFKSGKIPENKQVFVNPGFSYGKFLQNQHK